MKTNQYNNNITNEDKEYIKQNFEKLSVQQIAQHLHKKPVTIYKIIKSLGLYYTNRDGKVWTEDEINFLKENYLIMTYEDIAIKLGRSHKSVVGKAHGLQLSKNGNNNKNWSEKELAYLRSSANSIGYDEIAKHLNRSIGSIYNKVYELQLIPDYAKKCRKIKREQILFIINNAHKMTDHQLAVKFNISEKRVSDIRKQHGIKKTGNEISGPTYIEKFVQNVLDENNILYDYNKKIGDYFPDFFICNTKLIIEVQGDYFHCNPYVYQDGPKDEIQIKHIVKDYYKKCYFISRGYNIIYIWEKDINENPENVRNEILNVCRSQLNLTENCE